MSTRGRAVDRVDVELGLAGVAANRGLRPPCILPSHPNSARRTRAPVPRSFITSRAAWIASFSQHAHGDRAGAGRERHRVEVHRAVGRQRAGRAHRAGHHVAVAPVNEQADSSSASVPCVPTMPSTSSRVASALRRRASVIQLVRSGARTAPGRAARGARRRARRPRAPAVGADRRARVPDGLRRRRPDARDPPSRRRRRRRRRRRGTLFPHAASGHTAVSPESA